MAPRVNEASIWHYTDAQGALGIVETDTLWATSIAFLNDDEEYQYGIQQIQALADDACQSKYVHPLQKLFLKSCLQAAMAPEVMLRTFVLCASKADDSLAQWRAYGGATGYSFELDPKPSPILLCEDASDQGFSHRSIISGWRSVLYARLDQQRLAAQVVAAALSGTPHPEDPPTGTPFSDVVDQSATNIVSAAAFMKHPAFVEEQEVRSIISVVDEIDVGAVKRRPTKYGIAPYVRATFDTHGKEIARRPDTSPLPLRGVRVGPGPSQNSARAGFGDLLAEQYGDIRMDVSSAPLR